MSSGSSVPSLHSVRWDVSCSSTEEESPLGSPTCSSSPSSCQVSSSSAVLRSSSKKKLNKTQTETQTFPPSVGEIPSNYDVESHDNRSSHDEPVDSPAATTMGLDTLTNYRSRNSNRRVSSPHPDGTVKKSNKPQMERRRRQRINESVNELRKCISEVFKVDPSRHDKLEKADILELTVKYFHYIQSRCNVKEWSSECKPIRLERKRINDDYSAEEKYPKCDVGVAADQKYNGINDQPLTLIIQTLPQSFQNHFGSRDQQYLLGYNGNSISAQPAVVANQNPPVIQLNITNNISNSSAAAAAAVDSYHTFPSQSLSDNSFINPSFPDTASSGSQYDFDSERCISLNEELNGYSIDPSKGLAAENKCLINPKKGFLLNRNDPSGRMPTSLGRPIAPKPLKKSEEISQMNNIPQPQQDIPNETEQVWRPWDGNRKILKPHVFQ